MKSLKGKEMKHVYRISAERNTCCVKLYAGSATCSMARERVVAQVNQQQRRCLGNELEDPFRHGDNFVVLQVPACMQSQHILHKNQTNSIVNG
jgi:hypothetical protein